MNKKAISFIAAAAVIMSNAVSVAAFEEWSYSDELSVYVNGQKIDNEQYKPIIVNDRTLVRLVPVFEALGYTSPNGYDENSRSVTFVKEGTNAAYTFTAESYEAVIGTDGGNTYTLDVPATLQYFDVFYVPIRAFCEMAGLDISWDNDARAVYISGETAGQPAEDTSSDNGSAQGNETVSGGGAAQTPETSGSGTTGESAALSDKELGFEYCCFGRVVGKGTLQEFETGTMSYNTLVSISEEYIAMNQSYETDFGMTPQEALDLVSIAFDSTPSGSVHVYSDHIDVLAVQQDPDVSQTDYRIMYSDNDSKFGVPCYYVSTLPEEGSEYDAGSVVIFDTDLNIIGNAN